MYTLLSSAPHHEDVLGSGDIAPRILKLGTRWRWVVSFTLQPLYPWGKTQVPNGRKAARGSLIISVITSDDLNRPVVMTV